MPGYKESAYSKEEKLLLARIQEHYEKNGGTWNAAVMALGGVHRGVRGSSWYVKARYWGSNYATGVKILDKQAVTAKLAATATVFHHSVPIVVASAVVGTNSQVWSICDKVGVPSFVPKAYRGFFRPDGKGGDVSKALDELFVVQMSIEGWPYVEAVGAFRSCESGITVTKTQIYKGLSSPDAWAYKALVRAARLSPPPFPR
jgi:hypothetical protein